MKTFQIIYRTEGEDNLKAETVSGSLEEAITAAERGLSERNAEGARIIDVDGHKAEVWTGVNNGYRK